MKIEVTDVEEKPSVILDDEGFNAPGFLTVNGEDVHINELYPAVKAFRDKYFEGLKRENLME
jgi:hypothetical protein